MAEMRLSHGDTRVLISQAEDAVAQAFHGVRALQDAATEVTASAWLGVASNKFQNIWQQSTDELRGYTDRLAQVVEQVKNGANVIASHDTEV